jgi:predicted nucleic acid-binding protein
VDGYLLDTSFASALLDAHHKFYENVRLADEAIEAGAPRFVSIISLAELMFGVNLYEAESGEIHTRASQVLRRAHSYPILEIGKHTATEYAELRTKLAITYLTSLLHSDRPRWVDQWVPRVTGEKLQVDENDLWICAQARERNLTLLTTDKDMVIRISKADPTIKFRAIEGTPI